jgi:hypothetical protein
MGVNVGSKTFNMVSGGGINSPHPPTSRYQPFMRMGAPGSLMRHRCAKGHFQRLVLTASRWADGTLDSSVCRLKFQFLTRCSRVSARGEGISRARLGPLSGAPDSPVHTGQSGAPKTETLILIFFCFSNPFSF